MKRYLKAAGLVVMLTLIGTLSACNEPIYADDLNLKTPIQVEWVVVHKESSLVKEKQEDLPKEQHVLYTRQRVNGVWCVDRYVERICVGYGRPGEDRCGTTKVYQVSPDVFN